VLPWFCPPLGNALTHLEHLGAMDLKHASVFPLRSTFDPCVSCNNHLRSLVVPSITFRLFPGLGPRQTAYHQASMHHDRQYFRQARTSGDSACLQATVMLYCLVLLWSLVVVARHYPIYPLGGTPAYHFVLYSPPPPLLST